MNDFKLLQMLFGNKLIKAKSGLYDKYCIELKEESSDYSITILNTPQDAVAIKTDSFPDLQSFFNCSSDKGQCKRADFVIIVDKKLVFIELSKGKKQENEVIQQLKGAQCVIEYCRYISAKFYDYESFLKGYHSCFVSIYNVGANKRGSRVPSKENHMPCKFLRISAPHHLIFNSLCCAE